MESSSLGIGSRVRHPAFGDGVVIKLYKAAYDISFMTYGIKSVGRDYKELTIIEAIEAEEVASFNEAEQALIRILRTYNGIDETTQLGDKWIDGTLILKPGEDGLSSKEMPIDDFFHKIVMVPRSPPSDGAADQLQQYDRRREGEPAAVRNPHIPAR